MCTAFLVSLSKDQLRSSYFQLESQNSWKVNIFCIIQRMRSSLRESLFQVKNPSVLSYLHLKFVDVWNQRTRCTSGNLMSIIDAPNCIKWKIHTRPSLYYGNHNATEIRNCINILPPNSYVLWGVLVPVYESYFPWNYKQKLGSWMPWRIWA